MFVAGILMIIFGSSTGGALGWREKKDDGSGENLLVKELGFKKNGKNIYCSLCHGEKERRNL